VILLKLFSATIQHTLVNLLELRISIRKSDNKRNMIACVSGFLLFVFSSVAFAESQNVDIQDFKDPNAATLWQALGNLENGNRLEPIRIIQLGDSHTAGDYLTGRLRQQLQTKYGDAGIGWLTPGYVINQRYELATMKAIGKWQMSDSKLPKTNDVFPLGGLFNTSGGASIMDVKAKQDLASGSWQLSIWHKNSNTPWKIALPSGKLYKMAPQDHIDGQWNLSNIALNSTNAASLRLLAPNGGSLGGIALDRMSPGITLDVMGINGAKASIINRWDQNSVIKQLIWRNPQLIILAYGTNEAFENDITDYANQLRQVVRLLKQAAPNSAILIVGAPASAKTRVPNYRAGCRLPLPPNLTQVMNIQKRIAKQEHTLYWDWSAIMGGKCGAANWLNTRPQLMRKDMIHFSAEGYVATADALFNALVKAAEKYQVQSTELQEIR
jgi:lysophospholipase L1-like esterase